MGLTILRAPHSEVAPHESLSDAPTFEYYPEGEANVGRENCPKCKLRIVARNHLRFDGDSDKLIYGTLEVTGEPHADGIGFTFKFEDVRFKAEALNAVWSIRATAYAGDMPGQNGEFDLQGILVTLDPIARNKPVIDNPPVPVVHKFAIF